MRTSEIQWSGMFSIKFNSGVPIYRQIVEQVKWLVDRDQLKFGELLPSVRVLAGELGVNPMTVSRAYSVLETESVVERKRGVGMVVIQRPNDAERVLRPAIRTLIEDAQQLGLSEKELNQLIRQNWKLQVSQ